MHEDGELHEVGVMHEVDPSRGGDGGGGAVALDPPRFRWTKRIACVVAAVWIFALGARLVAGHVARQRLDSLVAEIRAAGEPILPQDFVTEPIPDDRNAAVSLMNAAAAYTIPGTTPPLSDIYTFFQMPDGLAEDPRAIRFIDTNGAALALVHEARLKPQVDWGIPIVRPIWLTMGYGGLGGQRALGKLESVAALYCHDRGGDDRAVEHLMDGLAAADALAAIPDSAAQLTAIATTVLELQTMEDICWNLAIGGDDNVRPRGATPDQVQALTTMLLDEEPWRRGRSSTVLLERAAMYDLINSFCDGTISSPQLLFGGPPPPPALAAVVRWLAAPAWQADGHDILLDMNELIVAERQESYLPSLALLPSSEESVVIGAGLKNNLFAVRNVSSPISFAAHLLRHRYATVAQRRMAALALAIRRYELAHGDRPERLEELAPDFLSDLPADPFAADHSTFQYIRNDTAPKLYSVGPNLKDDGGAREYGRQAGVPDDVSFRLGPRANP